MMEKFAQAGEGGGRKPSQFHYHVQRCVVRFSWEADTFPHFLLYPYMYPVSPLLYPHLPHELYILIEAEQKRNLRTTLKFLRKIASK